MRKHIKACAVVLLAVSLLALAGCGSNDTAADTSAYAGTYVSEENPDYYIEIGDNNTFTLMSDGEETSGSCDVEGDSLLLSAGSYNATMEISEDVITDEDGNRYIKGYATVEEAIEAYCAANGIDIPDLTVSEEKQASQQDPDWEVDYAFPAEAEGEGVFFLLQNTDGAWAVIAHTEEVGWTAAQLKALGAPTDLVLERYVTAKEAIEAYCAANGIDIPDLTVSEEKQASQQDPDWEVDYAFPAEAEGEGVFFLLQNTDGAWAVIAHTEEVGWTAEQLKELGAPTDLVL